MMNPTTTSATTSSPALASEWPDASTWEVDEPEEDPNTPATTSSVPELSLPGVPSSVVDFVKTIQPVNLLQLARDVLKEPLVTDGGPRYQSRSELTVLAIHQLHAELEAQGSGLEVHEEIPYVYSGTHWVALEESTCRRLLANAAERIGIRPADARYHQFHEQLRAQLQAASGRFGPPPADPSAMTTKVNLANGTLWLTPRGEEMQPFRREDFLTWQLSFEHDPAAQCPRFLAYLHRVLPDAELQTVLAEFFGYVFVRDLKLEKVLLLFGQGHNGKSVLFDIMNALFGPENVQNFSLGTLSRMENRVALSGKLLNFGSEISSKLDVDLFKKLASNEPIEARRLYQNAFTMTDYARLAFNANTLPREIEQTAAFFRRFLIIPFDQTITEEEKDPDLARRIIAEELPGVFNWVLAGLRRVRARRCFTTAKRSTEVLNAYRKESDSVALFLEEESLVPTERGTISKGEFYLRYTDFCRDSGFSPLNKRNVGQRLQNTHHVTDRKTDCVRYWNLESRPVLGEERD